MKYEIDWQQAEPLLRNRDRYTQAAIKEAFQSTSDQDAIVFDPVQRGYVTPVLAERYSVIWYEDPVNQVARVRAVVPLPHVSNPANVSDSAGLKEYIQRAVFRESHGAITVP